jgi:uncharacterized protein
MTAIRACLTLLVLLSLAGSSFAAEVIPPVPASYFNDYANVVSSPVADALNRKLEQFERDTSNQIVVAIYPKMQSDSDLADYTFRVKETWHVGQKSTNNGAVLFVFVQDRKAFIQVNYGLEGALPDATCKQIIDNEISPHLQANDYDAGLTLGISAILAATRGEYRGNGHTSDEQIAHGVMNWLPWIGGSLGAFLLLGLILLLIHTCGGTFYGHHARSLGFIENIYLFVFNMLLNIVFSGSSSSSSSSSGGFSGGGGTGGGGGAGGSW